MAVPKRKMSKARRDRRRANWKLSVPGMVECPQCHEMKMPHRVCPECGSYNGKQVIAAAFFSTHKRKIVRSGKAKSPRENPKDFNSFNYSAAAMTCLIT